MTAAGLNDCGALGRRHRLELSMLSPELELRNENIILTGWKNGKR